MTIASLQARKEENSRLLREDQDRGSTFLRGLPEIIALHTTEKCNLRCVMCPRHHGQGKRQFPRERLAALCDELFPTAIKVAVSAAAGEPLLADFDLILEKALAHQVRMDIVTNGSEFTGDLYRAGAAIFDHVNVSVDCAKKEVYERLRVGGRFDVLSANLRAIQEERARSPDDVLLSISAVLMRSTAMHLSELLQFAKSLDVDGVIIQPLSQGAKATPEEALSNRAQREAVLEARSMAREIGVNVFFSDMSEEGVVVRPHRDKVPPLMKEGPVCWYLLQHFGVQPTGEVYSCCYQTDQRLGSLMETSAQDLWNGPVAQQLRAAHYSRRGTLFCSGCVHAPMLKKRGPWWISSIRQRRRLRALYTPS